VVAHGGQFGRVAVDSRPREHAGRHQVDEVRQPGDMVEVGVGQENVQTVSAQVLGEVAHSRASVEHDADLGQQHTRRVTLSRGIVAASAKQDKLHGVLFVFFVSFVVLNVLASWREIFLNRVFA
jgi:hypothetical protein